jgi:DNA (cytosine-5)-methyltransferase 1
MQLQFNLTSVGLGRIDDKMSKYVPDVASEAKILDADDFRTMREQNGLSVDETASLFEVQPRTVRRWENGETRPKKAYVDVLRYRLQFRKPNPEETGSFTFIDLFAGIGGMRRGFESAGGRCVFTSEWDKYSQQTYNANFPDEHEIAGDITEIDAADIPEHDVLLAGFPCQPFSIAGVSKLNSLGRAHGFMNKTQGTLFFEVLRILKHHRPAAFLLENVKNLTSHNGGDTFRTIVGALENELGYHVSTRVIDAAGYVPQHRERIFIAGFRQDTGFDFDRLEFRMRENGPSLESILHSPDEEPEKLFTLPVEGEMANTRSAVNERYTLSDKLWEYLKAYAAKHKAAGNGFGYGINTPESRARTLSARYYKDGSEILIDQGRTNPRRLTPRECARLMGFDPDWNTRMEIPVSDTRAYQQFGNAVVVPVVSEIARYMQPHIMRITNPGEMFAGLTSDSASEQTSVAFG